MNIQKFRKHYQHARSLKVGATPKNVDCFLCKTKYPGISIQISEGHQHYYTDRKRTIELCDDCHESMQQFAAATS
jgi:hypothetical protein